MRTSHAGHADQVQWPDRGVTSSAHRRCTHPARHIKGCDGFIDQGDVAIVGHHEIDLDTQPTEFSTEASGGCREPTDGGDRGKFGGGEDDTHERSLADATRDMGDPPLIRL